MVGLKYVGKHWIKGIPARDLTSDEVKKYGGMKKLIATGLYKKIELEEFENGRCKEA